MNNLEKHISFFDGKRIYGDFNRLGKLFKTKNHQYMYDLGTGKVVQCTKEEFLVLENIFANNGLTNFKEIPLEDECLEKVLVQLENSINRENLLMAPKWNGATEEQNELQFALDHKLVQVTLELTQRCNLECRYCINGKSFHQANRNGSAKDMSAEIAKTAIDYLFSHSGDKVAVTFYGGEPLLKYDLLKELVEYSRKKNRVERKELSFSMTTNLALMTREIAEYLASIEDFAVLCSIDGPEAIHDEHRVMHDGSGSFKKVIAGLKLLIDAYGEKASTYISINSVMTPPYTMEKFDEMQAFYRELSWLPKELSIQTTYVEIEEDSELAHIFKDVHGEFEPYEIFSPLCDWIDKQDEKKEDIFCKEYENEIYMYIHKRDISEKPIKGYSLSGCCVPGAQRLYVTVDGDYKVCERVNNAPILGNVHTGVDIQLVQKNYLNDYLRDAAKDCAQCWAARLCRICFADCFNKEKKYDSRLKKENCQRERALQEMQLIKYHQILEDSPESLNHLNDIYLA